MRFFRIIFVILFLFPSHSFPASFLLQFQGISDFQESRYFQTSFYPEINAYLPFSFFGSYYLFCVGNQESCQSYYVPITEPFELPVRAILPLTIIQEGIRRYAPQKIIFEIPSDSVYEILPEFKDGLKDFPQKIIFDARLKDMSITKGKIISQTPDGRSCDEKFPHFIKADMNLEMSASMGGGRDIFIDVFFTLPITVDLISWIPDIRYIFGEMPLKRSTLYTVFGRCDYRIKPTFYYELPYSPRMVIGQIKSKKESLQGVLDFDLRLYKVLSYVIESFLSTLDFRPIVFPILVFPLADIKKSYMVKFDQDDALALEFGDKGVVGLADSPSIWFSKSPNRVIASDFAEIKVGGDKDTLEISFSLDGGVWSEWIKKDKDGFFSFVVTDLLQGAHQISILGRNIYGNINEEPISIGFFVDRTPPSLDVRLLPYANRIKGRISAKDNFQDNIKVEMIVRKDGKDVFKKTFSFLGEIEISEDVPESGLYTLLFQGKDSAGNSSEVIYRNVIIDRVPPKIRVVNQPPSKINLEQINLLIELEDDFFPYGIVNYFIEEVVSERRKTCFSQWGISRSLEIQEPYGYINISGLENDKTYHVCLYSYDPAGNSGDIIDFEFQIDRTPPRMKINSFPQRITYEIDQEVEIFVEDDLSEPDDIKIFFNFSGPKYVSRTIRQGNIMKIFLEGLPDLKFKFSAYAIDEAGNVSNFEEREFIVDTSLKKLGGGGGVRLNCQSFDTYHCFGIFFLLVIATRVIRPKNSRKNGT